MPKLLDSKPTTQITERHFTGVHIFLPVGGAITLQGDCSKIVKDSDGNIISSVPDGNVVLSEAEIKALPVFLQAYQQLQTKLHESRDAQDVVPEPEAPENEDPEAQPETPEEPQAPQE